MPDRAVREQEGTRRCLRFDNDRANAAIKRLESGFELQGLMQRPGNRGNEQQSGFGSRKSL